MIHLISCVFPRYKAPKAPKATVIFIYFSLNLLIKAVALQRGGGRAAAATTQLCSLGRHTSRVARESCSGFPCNSAAVDKISTSQKKFLKIVLIVPCYDMQNISKGMCKLLIANTYHWQTLTFQIEIMKYQLPHLKKIWFVLYSCLVLSCLCEWQWHRNSQIATTMKIPKTMEWRW